MITQEDVPLTIQVASILGNDFDFDGDALELIGVGAVEHASLLIDEHGNILFTPEDNFFGVVNFTYTVRDYLGASSVGTVTVNITPVNDRPVARTDYFSTQEDTVKVIPADPVPVKLRRKCLAT